jgi:arylsulfatase A-like enzyme
MVQHKAPHRRWEPPAHKLAAYNGKKFPEPPTLLDDYAGRGTAARTAHMRINQMHPEFDVKLWDKASEARKFLLGRMSSDERSTWAKFIDPRRAAFESANPQGDDRTRWFYQLYMQDYMACVESVDDSVGRLLKYLDDTGLAKNTIVVYTSDQGFYLGEHGWFGTAGSTSGSCTRNLCGRPWSCAGRASSGPARRTSKSFPTLISPRRFSKPPVSIRLPICRAVA